ncbi:MAG: hypothetical protein LBI72_05870 [Flavobacteriaceae bacterium]|nr:hypothetical protein [Flavobacteriaceae bacterium]
MFLPFLGSGEAIIMGVDFPMSISVKVYLPTITPKFKIKATVQNQDN